MNNNHSQLRLSAVRLLAVFVCIICGLFASAYDFDDGVFKYLEYYDEPDGAPAVVVDGVLQYPADGILNLPAYVTHNDVSYRVVGWDGGSYNSETGSCTKLILPETFRELGVTVSSGYDYAVLNDLIRRGLKEIEINPANPWFKIQDGFMLSTDGKKLFYISDAIMSAPDLVIPEGVEFIYPNPWKEYTWYSSGEAYFNSRRCITLPASLKYTDEIYYGYPLIILKSEEAPETLDFFKHGSDSDASYTNEAIIYVPEGTLDAYRYSSIWGYANSLGFMKEMDMASGQNVEFNFYFYKDYGWPDIKVNDQTVSSDSYTISAKPLTPVTLVITIDGELSYFNDSNWPAATCRTEDLGDSRLRYTYMFIPQDNCVISAGKSATYVNPDYSDYYFTLTHDGLKLVEYFGDDSVENLIIPSSIGGYDVTELGSGLYAYRDIKHVTLPSSLKRIGSCCFIDAGLQELNLPDGLEQIDDKAFANNTDIRDIKLPGSIKVLNCYAFQGCDLKSCNIPSDFKGYKKYLDPLFNNAGGEDGLIDLITIEASDETFGQNVAAAKKLVVNRTWYPTAIKAEEIELNSKKVELNLDAFHGCQPLLQKISVKGDDCVVSGRFRMDEPYVWSSNYEFNLKDINIESSSLKIGDGAFVDLDKLTTVNIKTDGGEGLGESVFEHCRALTGVSLSGIEGGFMTAIFRDCDKLTSIKINEGIDYINGIAFQRCSSLKRVEFPHAPAPVVMGTGAFDDCPVEEIFLDRTMIAPEPTFFRCETLKRLEIGSNVTVIADYTFADCTNLREIYCDSAIPPTIGYNTFRNVPTDECHVYVKGGDGEYRDAGGWKEFFPASAVTEIENHSISVASAAGVITVSGAEGQRLAVYTVAGTRAFYTESASASESVTLDAGLYIVVAGNETFKINHK